MATKKPSYLSAEQIYAETRKELKAADDLYSKIYNIRRSNFQRTGMLSGIQQPPSDKQKEKIAELNRERNKHMRRFKTSMAKIRWDSSQGVYVMR